MPVAPSATVLADGLTFTEGPRWHDGMLWFSDFYTESVCTVTLDGHLERLFEVPGRPSGLGWLPDGDLLVVSMGERRLLRYDGGRLVDYADLSGLATGDCNDMVVAANGVAFIGNFGYDIYNEDVCPAVLIRVTPERRVEPAADAMHFPNGSVIAADGTTLIVAESFARRLTAFDIDAGGVLTNRRVWADLGDYFPDGICLDRNGGIWVATPMSADALIRVEHGGRITQSIALEEGFSAYACALSDDGQWLLVCSSRHALPDDCQRHRSARIECVDLTALSGAGH